MRHVNLRCAGGLLCSRGGVGQQRPLGELPGPTDELIGGYLEKAFDKDCVDAPAEVSLGAP
jgi:hypothetical protein